MVVEFEFFSTKIGFVGKQLFRINIPKSNPKKYFMNSLAFMVILGLLPNFFIFYSSLSLSSELQAVSMVNMIFGNNKLQVWHNGLVVLSVMSIYIMSYWVEVDNRHPLEKIEQLSVPSLWKSTLKI